MNLSFIIVNYNSERYLRKCISSIKEKVLGVDYEIIVVNNNNVPPSFSSGKDKNPPLIPPLEKGDIGGFEIKIINTGENIGFGAACNAGAKIAKGEILCFLNPDTEIVSKNIQDLLNEFNKDDKLEIIGPKLLSDKNEIQWWCAGKEITIRSIILNNLGYKRDKKIWESAVPIECAWVSGAAMFIRKDIFSNPPSFPLFQRGIKGDLSFSKGGGLGGFDEKFFMYFEDIDLCKRARLAGYKILYYPDFAIKHFGGKSFLDKKEQKKYYRKSQRRYLRKHFHN